MVTTTIPNLPSCVELGPQQPWYVPDRRIRTKSAATTAVRIVEWIQTGVGLEAEPAEQDLFAALHTCAYRITHNAGGTNLCQAERPRWADRWRIIRAYIVEKNLGLAHSMVNRIQPSSRNLYEDDLLSDALFALTRAVDRFNPWKGFRFSTYACNAIIRTVMKRREHENRYRQRFPTQQDIGADSAEPLPDFHTELYIERLNRGLDRNLGELTDLERHVIARRFPMDGNTRLTLERLGQEVGLSKERIRQIQQIALGKLRELLDQDLVLA